METDSVPPEANALHQRGRELGAAGDHQSAIKVLTKAQALAPDWPYPTYDIAFTYLLIRDFEKAREHYRRTVEMSPRGFFTAITALDTLNREAKGELPEGVFAAYSALEWLPDPAQRADIIEQLTVRFPAFAPAWKEYALLCEDSTAKLAAIEKGLAASPDRGTKGILLLNQALTLHQQGEPEQAHRILNDLIADPETTLSNEQLAKQCAASLLESS